MGALSVEANIEKQDSVVRRLEVIGEAAAKLPSSTKSSLEDIPWASIVGLRNILGHQYWEIDFDELWVIIHRDLPQLVDSIERFRSS